ncbi:MAG: glycosyltransferase [bacterium]|nr:glycosyltransferase [bacterium]
MNGIKNLRNRTVKLSIVIATYNRLNYLEKCINSIIKKKIDVNYEVIVVDSGSNDGTLEFLESYSEIRVIKDNLRGPVKAYNKGFKVAKGEYIFWVNDDIIILNDSINKMLKFLEENPDIGIGTFNYNIQGEEKKYCFGLRIPNFAIIKASLLKELNYLDESFYYYYVDIDIGLKVWEYGLAVVECKEAKLLHLFAEDERKEYGMSTAGKEEEYFKKKWEDKIRDIIESIPKKIIKELFSEEEKIELLVFKAIKFSRKEMIEEAEEVLRRVLLRNDLEGEIRLNYLLHLANILIKDDRFEEADRELNDSFLVGNIDIKRKIIISYRFASFCKDEKILGKAKEKFEEIIELTKKLPLHRGKNRYKGSAHFQLGEIFKKLNENEEAIAHFQKCLKLIPEHGKAKEYLSGLEFERYS